MKGAFLILLGLLAVAGAIAFGGRYSISNALSYSDGTLIWKVDRWTGATWVCSAGVSEGKRIAVCLPVSN